MYTIANNEISRHKWENTTSLIGAKEFFEWYKKTPSNAIKIDDYELYIGILRTYNRAMFKTMLVTGNRIKLPFALGSMLFVRNKTNTVLTDDYNIDTLKSKLLVNRSKTLSLWKRDSVAKANYQKVYYDREYFATLKWRRATVVNGRIYYFKYNNYCSELIKEVLDGNEKLLDLYEGNEYHNIPTPKINVSAFKYWNGVNETAYRAISNDEKSLLFKATKQHKQCKQDHM